MIYYNSHNISKSDLSSVKKALQNEKISKGKNLLKFEKVLKLFFKCKYCLVMSSGTSAQMVLARSLNWKKNDNIILSPFTFVSGANSIVLSNANPVFVDINDKDYNLNPKLVKAKILELKRKKKKVKAIICTDYGGMPADWKELRKIANKFKIKLINDNCHALGSKYFNKFNYSTKYADYVIQSFHAVKNITTGEGGAILTNDKKIYDKAKSLREHGFENPKINYSPWDYDIKELPSLNFRLSDINCALGSNQLKRIHKIIKKRREIARQYDAFFRYQKNLKTLNIQKNKFCSYHLYPILINFEKFKISPLKFFYKMKKKYKIQLQKHYTPTYKFHFYKKNFKIDITKFNNTEYAYKNIFSLPIYEKLSFLQVRYICSSIFKILKINHE